MFSEKAKNFGDSIITALRAEFVRRFKTSDWMDEQTREKAIQKIGKLNPKIGYPTKVSLSSSSRGGGGGGGRRDLY